MERKITVMNYEIKVRDDNYINLIDIAKKKNINAPKDVVKNWLRNRMTLEFLGLWESINNENFNGVEFDSYCKRAGLNSFTLSPFEWGINTNAIGLVSKKGPGGGVYAHKDIALEFASWVSVEFKLYLIKEFQRLKEKESCQLKYDWNLKRILSKINYKLHTQIIKENLIPKKISKSQASKIYSEEADILNIALFGKTSKEWKLKNKLKKGNIRDYANISQLICLSNLENLNSVFIKEKLPQQERLLKLNEIAIYQMKILIEDKLVKKLK